MSTINSSAFADNYVIFIDKKAVNAFNEYINANQWKHRYGVMVLESLPEELDLAVITIPCELNHSLFEKDLFEWKMKSQGAVKSSGFWGQQGIGYANKEWNIL